jgi:hypothetical protein
VWGRNIRVVIIPSILAFAYFGPSICFNLLADFDLLPSVMWITSIGAEYIEKGTVDITYWGDILVLTGLTASMVVNALMTGLIVFRIFKVFHEVRSHGVTTLDEKSSGGRNLGSIIFIIIESGMALFAIQLARLVLVTLNFSTTAEIDTYQFIIGIHEMLNVSISLIIVTLYLTNDMDLARA